MTSSEKQVLEIKIVCQRNKITVSYCYLEYSFSPTGINVPVMVNQELVQDKMKSCLYKSDFKASYTISSQVFENKAEHE
jgi:hypothetical protein